MTCDEVGLPDVSSSSECFGSAMNSVGLSGSVTFYLPSGKFSCIHDAEANMVFFALGSGSETQSSSSWRYICPRTLTATVSSTTPATAVSTTVSVTTASATSTTSVSITSGPGYTLLPAGLTCDDVGLADVGGSADCFDTAAPAVGVAISTQTLIPSKVFKISCVYQAHLGALIFSEATGDETAGSSEYQYICAGSDYMITSTATVTRTATTATTTTASSATSSSASTTAVTTSYVDYTLLPAGQTCYEAGLQDVASSAECFGSAMASVDLGSTGSTETYDFAGTGFLFTCVYKTSSAEVFFSDSGSDATESSPNYQYICIGVLRATSTNSSI